ncbi:MAG: flagellar export protein FliJ [Thiotrichales bacterium]|nr:flagellar export protein FliJ [Thiotrichales bacterium]
MNRELERWQKLVELAEIEMENAAKTVAYLQQQLQEGEQQLTTLQSYLADYTQPRLPSAPMSILRLQTQLQFGQKVQQAVSAQQEKVEQQQLMVDKALQAWQEKRARAKALEQLRQKKQQAQTQRQNRQEQKQLDELAAQAVIKAVVKARSD